jgi:hypothetical protein
MISVWISLSAKHFLTPYWMTALPEIVSIIYNGVQNDAGALNNHKSTEYRKRTTLLTYKAQNISNNPREPYVSILKETLLFYSACLILSNDTTII